MAELLVVSPSSAPHLEACLFRFHTLEVLRKFPSVRTPSPVLRFGTTVHDCLRALYDVRKPGPLPHVERLDSILHFAFLRGGYSDDVRADEQARAKRLICNYLKQTDINDDAATVGTEVESTYTVTTKAGVELYGLTARLDRVLRFEDGLAAAIDYKVSGTSSLPLSSVVINIAALKKKFPDALRWELWIENLTDDSVERTIYKSSDLKGAIKELTQRVKHYQSAVEFPATRCSGCRWCPLRDTCPAMAKETITEDDLEF